MPKDPPALNRLLSALLYEQGKYDAESSSTSCAAAEVFQRKFTEAFNRIEAFLVHEIQEYRVTCKRLRTAAMLPSSRSFSAKLSGGINFLRWQREV